MPRAAFPLPPHPLPSSHSPALPMAPANHVSAVIFDVDGTLLDTDRVTRDTLNEFLATYGKAPDPEKEEKRQGQMYRDSATGIISDYELPLTLEEYTEAMHPLKIKRWQTAKPLPRVTRLVKHLHKNGVPLALASNSTRRNVGHKLSSTKGFLEAAKRLGANPSSSLVIEDSLVGVQAAKASGAKVVAVPSLQNQRQQYSVADVLLYSLLDFQPELWGLPPFEDRIQSALPIEPLFLSARMGDAILNNLHTVVSDDCTYEFIPAQISGIFFGWAKFEVHGFSKVVVSTGWDFLQQNPERVMQIDFLDAPGSIKTDPVKLLVIGYIRKLETEDNILEALRITDEDRSVARNALDLPVFSEHANGLF
ncbi:hypothetical protein ACP70R_036760 [Stipagrostis hirtigluma subsp. patula]